MSLMAKASYPSKPSTSDSASGLSSGACQRSSMRSSSPAFRRASRPVGAGMLAGRISMVASRVLFSTTLSSSEVSLRVRVCAPSSNEAVSNRKVRASAFPAGSAETVRVSVSVPSMLKLTVTARRRSRLPRLRTFTSMSSSSPR